MTSFKLKKEKKKSVQQRKQLSEEKAHRESLPVEFLIKISIARYTKKSKKKSQANTQPNLKRELSHTGC